MALIRGRPIDDRVASLDEPRLSFALRVEAVEFFLQVPRSMTSDCWRRRWHANGPVQTDWYRSGRQEHLLRALRHVRRVLHRWGVVRARPFLPVYRILWRQDSQVVPWEHWSVWTRHPGGPAFHP